MDGGGGGKDCETSRDGTERGTRGGKALLIVGRGEKGTRSCRWLLRSAMWRSRFEIPLRRSSSVVSM